jgi:hypothetical protein
LSTTVHGGSEQTSSTAANVIAKLGEALKTPNLRTARQLEDALIAAGYKRRVFGRNNQSASLEANAESDRGAAERLANAYDTELKAARLALGLASDPSLMPRNAAQRFFCPNLNKCEWDPQDPKKFGDLKPPYIEFWEEEVGATLRHQKYKPSEGFATFLIRDNGTGIERAAMADTILALNSDAKLQEWEAIGRFGHGGSSSLFFCEMALVMTQPRWGGTNDIYWTLVFPEKSATKSKQELTRMWFADVDDLPLTVKVTDLPSEVRTAFPGTSIWHFGYHRGGWIKKIAGSDQTNPWGRLGRLFFSYPLPFVVGGEYARGDNSKYNRTITSPFHRLVDAWEKKKLEYFAPEKREQLLVDGSEYGHFSFVAFVMHERDDVKNYVYPKHPVILTLNGQNHGEMTRVVLENANLPELSASMIVEVRLDNLDQEALGHIITNSREMPKNSPFTRALTQRLVELLSEDETLQKLEVERQQQKAKNANQELNTALSKFIRDILSDAPGRATPQGGNEAPGESGFGREAPPEIAAADPPQVLAFISSKPLIVGEGATRLAKFKTDARPPKYTFGGDNPRLFATWLPTSELGNRVAVVGHAEVNERGYGSVSIHCAEDPTNRISEVTCIGKLELNLQSTDGKVITSNVEVGIGPKPERREKRQVQDIRVEVVFSAPGGDPDGKLAEIFAEQSVGDFGTSLSKFKEALSSLPPEECTYWGSRHDRDDGSVLFVEINAANPSLQKLLAECRSAEERIFAKQRYCQDVALDCYQHSFRLDEVPDQVWSSIHTDEDEARKASEFYLNHDKGIRFAARERERGRK